ncbi:phage tail tape measure protein [Erysipelothrix anatis]|uniref:phage tail tape measure protein n=1 Tax=Erysipelothrix anatis TaxID=2683713 RepID=UPI00140C19DB|nr:phage tail tape measure protein [Erysipelothrix anatis]
MVIDFVLDNWQGLLIFLVNPFAGAFKLLYDNFEGFRNFVDGIVSNVASFFSNMGTSIGNTASSIYSTVSSVFESIKNAIMWPFQTAYNFVSDIISNIRGLFNFNWSWPRLPMPHFYARGSWNPIDWLSQGVPSIGVEWYAKGGIMNNPTAFGVNGNNMMVGGEKDPEAILPLNQKNLSGIGQGIVESTNFGMFEGIVTRLDTLIEIVKALLSLEPKYQILLDTGVLAGELTPYVNKELAKEEKRRGRGSSR